MAVDLRQALENARNKAREARDNADDEIVDEFRAIEDDIDEALRFLSDFEKLTDNAWTLLY